MAKSELLVNGSGLMKNVPRDFEESNSGNFVCALFRPLQELVTHKI